MDSVWKPQFLVFGNGGCRHLATLSFLVNLEDDNRLDEIKEICCCSTGAVLGLLLACRFDIRKIITVLAGIEIFDSISEVDLRSLIIQSTVTKKNPLFDEKLKRELTKMILERFGRIPSLSGLYKDCGISLKILCYDQDHNKPKLLDKDNSPELNCIDAVMYSSNLPGLFHRLYYRNTNLTEGSLANPYPLEYTTANENTLGFFLMPEEQEIPNPLEFHNNIFSTVCYNSYLQTVAKYPLVKHVLIRTNNYFDIRDRGKILAIGQNSYRDFSRNQLH